ncbi:MAG: hypothetical protein IBX43_07100 [Campylobacterales bacterium]|nr:hypothetical protein [Campylobacterales bacterium]
MNTQDNWVEIYAKNPENISDWSVRACAIDKCETVLLSYSYDADGYFKILQFGISFRDKVNDFVLYDGAGAIVDYFRLGMDLESYPLQIAEAQSCALDTACNIYVKGNSGQRNFARVPDGGCTWDESTWRNSTKDISNPGVTLPPPSVNYRFDVWDSSRSIADRAISTKLSAQDFTLTLAALDETNTAYQEFNGTVCTQIVDADGNAKSTWLASVFSSESAVLLSHTVEVALKEAFVRIVWKTENMSGTCPITAADGTVLSSDNFSIRPEKFDCESIPVSPLVSERPYLSSFIATPFGASSATPGYTSAAVVLSPNKYMRTNELNSSLHGTLSPATLSFVEGSAAATVRFNDVGDIGIDLNDSTWAAVDINDTPESGRIIHTECRRTFKPHHFKVDLTRPFLENNTTGFTYLSNDLNMSAWVRELNVTITAQGEANATMFNYADPKSTLYANAIALSPKLSLANKHSAATKRVDLADANSSDLSGFFFVNGTARYRYDDVAFNYERSHTQPRPPFVVEGEESNFLLKVRDNLYTDVTGEANTSSDANATFYYGRLSTNDISTTRHSSINPVLFEVFDGSNSPYTQGMRQTSLSWYINNLHTGNAAGNIAEARASSNMLIDNFLGGFTFGYLGVFEGKEAVQTTSATQQKATIHLNTQEWLWHVPLSLGSAYDYGPGSDCTMHPCFNFYYTTANGVLMIKSGDFNGTTVPDENRGDYLKKGVKVFR